MSEDIKIFKSSNLFELAGKYKQLAKTFEDDDSYIMKKLDLVGICNSFADMIVMAAETVEYHERNALILEHKISVLEKSI